MLLSVRLRATRVSRLFATVCVVAALLAATSETIATTIEPVRAVYRLGDDVSWADPVLDEAAWRDTSENFNHSAISPEQGKPVCWVRYTLRISGLPDIDRQVALYLSLGGDYDAYLNGRHLGASRRASDPNATEFETSGNFNNHFLLEKGEFANGESILALRLRNFDSLPSFRFRFRNPRALSLDRMVIREGDDSEWASRTIDESEWLSPPQAASSGFADNASPGQFWVRQYLYLSEPIDPDKPRLLDVHYPGSYELYWDGVYIGKNGVPGGSRESETPGRYMQRFQVPNELFQPGPHLLAYRISVNYPQANQWGRPFIQPYPHLADIRAESRWIAKGLKIAGFSFATMLLVGAFYVLAYVAYRRSTEYLAFGLICLCMAAATALYQNFFDRTDYHEVWSNIRFVHLIAIALGLLHPLFNLARVNASRKATAACLLAIGAIYLVSYPLVSSMGWHLLVVYYSVMVVGLTLGIFAVIRYRRAQDWLNLLGTLCLLLAYLKSYDNIPNFFSYWLGIGFTANACFLLVSLVVQMRAEGIEKERALVQNAKLDAQKARLELELLKTSIQPHFLMNTLTSVMEWVEENPAKSIQFIDTLAKEFRLLYEISSKSLIELGTELEICRALLEIMGYRQDVAYRLEAEDIDIELLVPPLIFHTLIENSITHNAYSSRREVAFRLEANSGSFRFTAPLAGGAPRTRPTAGTGTGLRYVKARLEENYPGRWSLDEERTDNTYVTTITIQTRIPLHANSHR